MWPQLRHFIRDSSGGLFVHRALPPSLALGFSIVMLRRSGYQLVTGRGIRTTPGLFDHGVGPTTRATVASSRPRIPGDSAPTTAGGPRRIGSCIPPHRHVNTLTPAEKHRLSKLDSQGPNLRIHPKIGSYPPIGKNSSHVARCLQCQHRLRTSRGRLTASQADDVPSADTAMS